MLRGDWSLEVFVCHLETGKGETGPPSLTMFVSLSAIRSHQGKKNYSSIASQNVSRKKKKWKVKIRRDEGELFTITKHTRVFLFISRVMITSQHLVGLKFSRTMLCPRYFPGKRQSISACQRQVHAEWGKARRKLYAFIARRRIVTLSV